MTDPLQAVIEGCRMQLRARALGHEGRTLTNQGLRDLKREHTTGEISLLMDRVRQALRDDGFGEDDVANLALSYASIRKVVEPPPP